MKISGVYKIINNITGDFYIGSSKDIKGRWARHRSHSTWKQLPNSKLYKAFIKFGLANFSLEIIEQTTDLHNREQYWIDQLKPNYNSNRANGWNIEQYQENNRRCRRERYKVHRTEELAMNSRLCMYEDRIMTLNALTQRFHKQGILHPYMEAKKYLL